MRALCGAIISAGALIGLGLAAIAAGLRYQHVTFTQGGNTWVPFKEIDTALMVAFYALLLTLGIGLGLAFFGLAYHHHRRHHEFLREHGRQTGERTPV
jgi:hypothetical protein